MKILMIAPTPFMSDRGCHTQILLEIKALQQRGHDIVVCTYGLGRDVAGVKTIRCWNFPWYNKLSAGPSYTKILLLPLLFITTLRTMRTYKPHIIHAHLHEGALIAKFCSIFFPNKLYVFDMQGSLTGECVQHGFIKKNGLGYRLLSFLEQKIVHWFPVITQSESMVKEIYERGVNPKQVANVKDGVDTELFSPQSFNHSLAMKFGIEEKRPRVLFMGLLETYQGVDLMFEAFASVVKRIPETQFLVIGFPNLERYQEKCKELKIEKNTVFFGRVDYFTLPQYLTLSSVAIAPKIAETEGDGKIYNYMAMGMTTIAFDRSVSREILANTGTYAEMNNAEDLATKIIWVLRHPEESYKLGQAARERAVAELSWKAVGSRLENAYLNFEKEAS